MQRKENYLLDFTRNRNYPKSIMGNGLQVLFITGTDDLRNSNHKINEKSQ